MRKSKHGFAPRGKRSPEYSCWLAMKSRCYIENDVAFAYYGRRGITVCDRWKNDFPAFLQDMGKRPPGKTLDRRDPNDNYAPHNCRWATRQEQAENRRNKRTIVLEGETVSLLSACAKYRMDIGTVRNRLRRGFTPEAALKTPLHQRVSHD